MEAKSFIIVDAEAAPEHAPWGARLTYAVGMTGLYVVCVAICALALFGCGTTDTDATLKQAFGYRCEDHAGKTANYMCKARPPGYHAEEVSRYCYKTLADANCFDQPDPDGQNQQVGSSGY